MPLPASEIDREVQLGSTIFTLAWAMAVIFVAAVIFVNAIEYLGYRFKLGGSFVGAILAPLFTSFPELTIFLVAVFSGHGGDEIGIGTLFGQPFMASSLSYGLVGIAALIGFTRKRRDSSTLHVDRSLALPYIYITILFPLTIVPGLLPGLPWLKYVMGVGFFAAFLSYIVMMVRKKEAALIEEAEEAYFTRVGHKLVKSPTFWAFFQLLAGVGMLFLGSTNMVEGVKHLSDVLGISGLGLALIIIPAATAIPETISALIWGYRGRDTMSIGSLVGEKILYSTFYPGLGMFITTWTLDVHAYASVAVTTVISITLLMFILRERVPWWGLCFGLFAFLAYAIGVFGMGF